MVSLSELMCIINLQKTNKTRFFRKNIDSPLQIQKKVLPLQRLSKRDAQMAESVDALVSNTSGATHPGSTPGLGTKETCRILQVFLFFIA